MCYLVSSGGSFYYIHGYIVHTFKQIFYQTIKQEVKNLGYGSFTV